MSIAIGATEDAAIVPPSVTLRHSASLR
jgi:hypothetical protein